MNIKVKISLCLTMHHAMKTMGEWKYTLRILNLGRKWMWVVSFMPRWLLKETLTNIE